tara:strand:+ start:3156 stop:3884 length:729 start_codon:yes stop_codon:yes gene_type:complete
MAKVKPMKKFVTRNLSEAIEKSVNDVVESGIDISELVDAVEKEPNIIKAESLYDENTLNELVEQVNKGKAIPGQSLTNDPNAPYNWEKPAKYSNPREALTNITADLLTQDASYNIVKSLSEGMAATDITTSILFAKFFTGEINPDVMLLLIEPILYTVMSLGSEAGVEYNIEPNDLNEEDEEDVQQSIRQFKNAVNTVKDKQTETNDNKLQLREDVLPASLLAKVKETGSEVKSLLSKQEEV